MVIQLYGGRQSFIDYLNIGEKTLGVPYQDFLNTVWAYLVSHVNLAINTYAGFNHKQRQSNIVAFFETEDDIVDLFIIDVFEALNINQNCPDELANAIYMLIGTVGQSMSRIELSMGALIPRLVLIPILNTDNVYVHLGQ